MNYKLWLYLVLAAILTFLPVPFAKEYYKTKNIIWIISGVLSLVLLVYIYTFIFRGEEISIYFPILKILAVFFSILVGVLVFKEKMTLKKGLGVIFAFVAIYLLAH